MIDILEIAVRMRLENHVSGGLGIIGRDVLGLRGKVSATEEALNKLRTAIISVGAIKLGVKLGEGLLDIGKAALTLQSAQAAAVSAGTNSADVAAMTAAAWKATATVMGTDVVQNFKLAYDAMHGLGTIDLGMAALPGMAKYGIYANRASRQHPDAEAADISAMKFLEDESALVDRKTGKTDFARFEPWRRMLEGVIAGTGGRVDQDTLMSMRMSGGGAFAAQDMQGIEALAAVAMSYQNGRQLGNQVNSLMRQLTMGGKHLTVQTMDEMKRLGLTNESKGAYFIDRHGVHVTDHSFLNEGGMLSETAQYVWNKLVPAMAGKGVNVNDPARVESELGRLGFNSADSKALDEMIIGRIAEQKNLKFIQKSIAGADPYDINQAVDPTTKVIDFTAAWHNLLTALGGPLVTPVTNEIQAIASDLDKLNLYLADPKHKNVAKFFDSGVAIAATVLAISGSIGLLTLALAPLAKTLQYIAGLAKTPITDAAKAAAKAAPNTAESSVESIGKKVAGSAVVSALKRPLLRGVDGRILSRVASDAIYQTQDAAELAARQAAKRGFISTLVAGAQLVPGLNVALDSASMVLMSDPSAGQGEGAELRARKLQYAKASGASDAKIGLDLKNQQDIDAIRKANEAAAAWYSKNPVLPKPAPAPTASSPMPVYVVGGGLDVTNPHAIGAAAAKGTATAMVAGMSGSDTGNTRANRRAAATSPATGALQ
jgi:hypothetical protein